MSSGDMLKKMVQSPYRADWVESKVPSWEIKPRISLKGEKPVEAGSWPRYQGAPQQAEQNSYAPHCSISLRPKWSETQKCSSNGQGNYFPKAPLQKVKTRGRLQWATCCNHIDCLRAMLLTWAATLGLSEVEQFETLKCIGSGWRITTDCLYCQAFVPAIQEDADHWRKRWMWWIHSTSLT